MRRREQFQCSAVVTFHRGQGTGLLDVAQRLFEARTKLTAAFDAPDRHLIREPQLGRAEVFTGERRRVLRLLADREVGLLGLTTETERSELVAEPASHKQVVWRRAGSRDPRHRDVAGQAIARAEQVIDDGPDVRLGEELSLRHLPTRQCVDLTE